MPEHDKALNDSRNSRRRIECRLKAAKLTQIRNIKTLPAVSSLASILRHWRTALQHFAIIIARRICIVEGFAVPRIVCAFNNYIIIITIVTSLLMSRNPVGSSGSISSGIISHKTHQFIGLGSMHLIHSGIIGSNHNSSSAPFIRILTILGPAQTTIDNF